MAIIIKPFDFIPGTVIRSLEVNQDFDVLYTDYNGNITNANIAAGAAIAFNKLAALPSGQIIVGSVGNVPTAVPMTGDATISPTGVVTIAGPAGGSFTPGSIVFIGAAGVFAQDNAGFFWADITNRLGIGTNTPATDLDISKSAVGSSIIARVRNTDNTNPGSHAVFQANTGGAAGGDPKSIYNNGIATWAAGVDTSDNNNYKISNSGDLGTNDRLTLRTNGEMLLPAVALPQPNYANRNSFVKAWGNIAFNGVIQAGYNVTSVINPSPGVYNVTLSQPFSSINYAVVVTSQAGGGNVNTTVFNTGNGTFTIRSTITTTGANSSDAFNFIAIGTQ